MWDFRRGTTIFWVSLVELECLSPCDVVRTEQVHIEEVLSNGLGPRERLLWRRLVKQASRAFPNAILLSVAPGARRSLSSVERGALASPAGLLAGRAASQGCLGSARSRNSDSLGEPRWPPPAPQAPQVWLLVALTCDFRVHAKYISDHHFLTYKMFK